MNHFNALYQREAPHRNRLYYVSRMLGHSSPTVTMEHYIHGMDVLLGDAVWRVMQPEKSVGYKLLRMPKTTFYRCWKEGRWSAITEHLRQHGSVGYVELPRRREPRRQASHTSLQGCINEAWEAVQYMRERGRGPNDAELVATYTKQHLHQWWRRYKTLVANRRIGDGLTYPGGKQSRDSLTGFMGKFAEAEGDPAGYESLKTIAQQWAQRKAANRAGVVFDRTDDARAYIDALLDVGLGWKSLRLHCLVGRTTVREQRRISAHWRSELNVSKRYSIKVVDTGHSVAGDGKIEVRLKDEQPQRAFNWLVAMMYIVLDDV